jgi:hypothetical protein
MFSTRKKSAPTPVNSLDGLLSPLEIMMWEEEIEYWVLRFALFCLVDGFHTFAAGRLAVK